MSEYEQQIPTLATLLDQLCDAGGDEETVSVEAVLKAVGRRSFGPVLLVPGVIALSPLSGIPGAPTVVGIMVLLVAGQVLVGREEFWLPQFILRRSISRRRFEKTINAMMRVARYVDRLVKPRLTYFTEGPAVYLIAAMCVALALTAPFLEVVPFSATGVGAAVTAFGLALTFHDGLLALLAVTFCGITGYLVVTQLF